MKSVRFSACLLGALWMLHGASVAQSPSAAPPPVLGIASAQSRDMRIGAFQPNDGLGSAMTDGGTRTAPSVSNFAFPLVTLGREYRVGPNDLIEVEVLEVEALKRTVRVNAAGAISLPLIGQVLVAGLSSQEIEARIADRYREKYLQDPQVSIFIKEFTTQRITIEGAVARPGIFPLAGQLTLLRALALAGGFGSIANTSQVMLYRVNEQQTREAFVHDIDKIRAGKSEDPPIRGDDLIVVQRDSTRVLLKDSLFRDIIDSVNPFSVFAR